MKYHGLNELREMFLSYFESKGHLRLPSFPLIPQNDASLLLIGSGMAPMKTWFTGEETPPRKRVATCQKCIRTVDIENIGKTSRHGTYFEMLGNFSFGDYFKSESLAWTWEFLVDVVGIDADRLYPSVYVEDDEAFDIWVTEVGLAPERVVRLGKEDNFWEHGSGPCGPSSEVYFDRGIEFGCGKPDCAPGCECDRFIEVWNNVFTQFSNDGEGNYTELSQKNIDTGMGLERLAVVCQNVNSLFDVDTVMNITKKVTELTGASYGTSKNADVSLRIITDHIRSSTMMICDGVLPSNEGRGYVLRRLLRRAARHGKLFGTNEPFLYKVCETVIAENSGAYPDLVEKQDYITRVIRSEEDSFAKTIDSGMAILSGLVSEYKARGDKVFSGADAFKLYDTYGFPIDLTVEILDEAGLEPDRRAFDELMNVQRERARTARLALGDLAWTGIDLGLDTTPTEFTGYDKSADTAKILALVRDGEVVTDLAAGYEGGVVLDKTPFYAEMGGQSADHGTIKTNTGEFLVTDVQKTKAGKYMHSGVVKSGAISLGAATAEIDEIRRRAIMRAHSATHILQQALRNVLGSHVEQAGSFVEPDRLRFDFTHFTALTAEELIAIGREVSEKILDGLDVNIREMPIAEARALGAMALFGEKYGDVVRVVTMGDYSVELCGGTHLSNTAKVGPFKIVSETSIAAGVRRIEAITGSAMLDEFDRVNALVHTTAEAFKTSPQELVARVRQFLDEAKSLRRELEKLRAKDAVSGVEGYLTSAKNIGGLKVITAHIGGADAGAMRQMGDWLRDKAPNIVAVLAASDDEKITFLSVCGAEAIAKGVKAGEIIKNVSAIAGGSGGGKPDSAMGGGKDMTKIDDALAIVDDFVAGKL